MKKLFVILLTCSCLFATGQTEILFKKADSLFYDYKDYPKALELYKQIETQITLVDTDWSYVMSKIARCLFTMEASARKDSKKSIELATQFIEHADKNREYIDTAIYEKKFFMYKNLVVAYFALEQLDKAKIYQDKLYEFYKQKVLPKGIDKFYNFEFFKWEGKNVWGYEFYPELGDPETKGSFSKIVYYVYSTNADGSDNEQLYRLHVLKFHKFDNSVKFDYVMSKRLETATNEVSGTFYDYTYTKPIDIVKLRADIREMLKGNYGPDAKSVIKKK